MREKERVCERERECVCYRKKYQPCNYCVIGQQRLRTLRSTCKIYEKREGSSTKEEIRERERKRERAREEREGDLDIPP